MWCFSENEEAEHRRVEAGLRRRCRRKSRLKCCGGDVGDLGFRESVIGFKEEEGEGISCVNAISNAKFRI